MIVVNLDFPDGWGFEIRSYKDGGYTVELFRFDMMPFAETGFTPIFASSHSLASALEAARLRLWKDIGSSAR